MWGRSGACGWASSRPRRRPCPEIALPGAGGGTLINSPPLSHLWSGWSSGAKRTALGFVIAVSALAGFVLVPLLAVMAAFAFDEYHLPSQWLLIVVPAAVVLIALVLMGRIAVRDIPKLAGKGAAVIAGLAIMLVAVSVAGFLGMTVLRIILKIVAWAWS
jgi:hypothetical protein